MIDLMEHPESIPSWQLYGEKRAFPDILHCERITDRAAGLDWVISLHRHPHLHQFFLIRAGDVEMNADGRRLVPMAPCVISVPAGVVHGFSFSAQTDGFVVTIPLQSLPDLFDPQASGMSGLFAFAMAPAGEELMDRFEELHEEHGAQRSGRATMLKALATSLVCQVLRLLPTPEEMRQTGPDRTFRRFLDLVQLNIREGWKPSDYANALGITARHLGRLCRRNAGQSPTAFLEAMIMREACRLLVYTRDSISIIGYQLSFDDPSYFSRAFRRHTGMTPRDYRASFEEE